MDNEVTAIEKKPVEEKSIKKNYFYNFIYQLFMIIVPLVATPYVSRVLNADGVGKHSFAYSICFYFMLLAALGFNLYGQRQIAKCLGDKEKQSKIFWEIGIIRCISTAISIGLYFVLIVSNLLEASNLLLLIMTLNIVAVIFDSVFIFQGNEDFKQVAIRNIVVKAVIIAAIFIFVKTKDDLVIYAVINALNPVLSVLIMLPFLKKYLVKVKLKDLKPAQHLVPCLKLFIPTIAVVIFTVIDRTMIGLLVPGEVSVMENGVLVVKTVANIENGYYEQAEKIVKMALTIITSIGVIMYSRNSSYFQQGEYEKVKEKTYTSISFVYFLAIPLMFGLIAIAGNLCPWFLGPGYEKVPKLIMLLSPLSVIIGISNVFGIQYIIPSGKDMVYTLSVVVGTVVNIILNICLVRYHFSYGAAVATLMAEFAILVFQMIYLRKVFSWRKVVVLSIKYLISGVIMFIPVYALSLVISATVLNTFLLVGLGLFIYGICMIIIRDRFAMFILNKGLSMVKKAFNKN